MQQFHLHRGHKVLAAVVIILLAQISPSIRNSFADQEPMSLQLEVFLNGTPTNTVSGFVMFGNGQIGAEQSELEQLGIRTASKHSATDVVLLDEIPTLKYEYVERLQRILITVSDSYRIPQTFDLYQNSLAKASPAQAGWGTALNYDLLSTTGNVQRQQPTWFGGTSLTLDGRAFSPYGTVEQSALVLSDQYLSTQAIRLDSYYRYSDQSRLISYGAGDVITSGLAWTRPIRIGGAQAQSNFALRPDLVTMPLPTLGGTAAVPSTVDVYVNNIKTFSQDIGAGPFTVSNVPLVTGAGNAELVLRDSAGQETRANLPFYAAASLLAPGLTSWSLEAGLPRLAYGSTTDAYVEAPVASATIRRGVLDWLTLEGHAEGGSRLVNGSIGAAVRTGAVGVAEAALAGSTLAGSAGLQSYISYDTNLLGFSIHASVQRVFGNYNDLASATARLQDITTSSSVYLDGFLTFLPYVQSNGHIPAIYSTALSFRKIDQISVGGLFHFDKQASWNLSYLHEVDALSNLSNILSVSYSRTLPHDASLFATIFSDFGTNKNAGIIAGLTIPFSALGAVTSSVSSGQGGTTATVDAVKSLGPAVGDYGWEVRDSGGATPYRAATLSYRTGYGTLKVGASHDQGNSNAGLEARGSIVGMGGHLFFTDWIDNAFAVVDTGAPGVVVSSENQPIGKSDAQGMFLLPTLRSYEKNTISIDPSNLPVDSEIPNTRNIVAPADRAGVLVRFNVQSDTTAALVVFARADGSFVPPGAVGKLTNGDDFVVGYDGQTFIKHLATTNSAIIQFNDASCHADFNFIPQPGAQVRIGPVKCQSDAGLPNRTVSLARRTSDEPAKTSASQEQSSSDAGWDLRGSNIDIGPSSVLIQLRR